MLQGEEQPKGTGESGFFEELGEALSSYGWSVRWEGPGGGAGGERCGGELGRGRVLQGSARHGTELTDFCSGGRECCFLALCIEMT